MNNNINKNFYVDSQGRLFENELAHHIFNLIFELTTNINGQTELLITLLHTFQYVNFKSLEFKERKRLEAIESWSKDILENINKFHLDKIRKFTPKLANEIYSIAELKEEFYRIINFMLMKMELEESITKETVLVK